MDMGKITKNESCKKDASKKERKRENKVVERER